MHQSLFFKYKKSKIDKVVAYKLTRKVNLNSEGEIK